ncbi:MAG: hypothetical protein HGA85_04245 [Nanoarchaeota archaeon]|nr:hypothetical protein [Nanoarchaeota archaeon]
MACKICSVPFTSVNKTIYLCNYKEGFVHDGCCHDRCSLDGKPCQNRTATFVNSEGK